MKVRHGVYAAVLSLLAGFAYAGLSVTFPVDVDLASGQANGDQISARLDPDDTVFIGCGSRTIDTGLGAPFRFGFCGAADAEGEFVRCFTENPDLLDEMRAASAAAFITFSFRDDGAGGFECTRVGFSTQSQYLNAD